MTLINLDDVDLDDEQTWLYRSENCQSKDLNIDIDDVLGKYKCVDETSEDYKRTFNELWMFLEQNGFLKKDNRKPKCDSRTYTRPKKRTIGQTVSETTTLGNNFNLSGTKTITKHRVPIKDRRSEKSISNSFDQYPSDSSDAENLEKNQNDIINTSYIISAPIDFKLSEPSNYHTFNNRFLGSLGSQSDSFSNISPPSLVSSITMEESGSFSRQGSVSAKRGTLIKDLNEIPNDDFAMQSSLYSNMTTSLLDERDMNTSFLSQADNQELSSHMIDSINFNMINSTMLDSMSFPSYKDMESSLINSGTFNNMVDSMEEKSFTNKNRFNLRRSFLNAESDLNKIGKNNRLKSNNEHIQSSFCEKNETGDDNFEMNEKENFPTEESFILHNRESESALERDYDKRLNLSSEKTKNKSEETVLLPNQVLPSETDILLEKRSNITNSSKNTPRRNATFRKIPSSMSSDGEIIKYDREENVDSNKEFYNDCDSGDLNMDNKSLNKKRDSADRTMVGSSSDSLEGSSSSERSPPQPTTVPLNMADLEYLAYQQHISLFQDTSSPLPKMNKTKMQDSLTTSTCSNKSGFSPLDNKKYGTYRVNSGSMGSIDKRNSSDVKRELSAPEIEQNVINMQKKSPGSPQKIFTQRYSQYGSDSGLSVTKSVSNSPLKMNPNSNQLSGSNKKISKLQYGSGSANELRPNKSKLSSSKLRQFSSQKELNKISASNWSVANGLHSASRGGFHSSNPSLYQKPLIRQDSYTITGKDSLATIGRNFVNPVYSAKEVNYFESSQGLIDKVTNVQINNKGSIPSSKLNYKPSLLVSQNRANVPTSMPQLSAKTQLPQQTSVKTVNNPSQIPCNTQRIPKPSGLPRPASGIPARKPGLRPPSMYSLAPKSNDRADYY